MFVLVDFVAKIVQKEIRTKQKPLNFSYQAALCVFMPSSWHHYPLFSNRYASFLLMGNGAMVPFCG